MTSPRWGARCGDCWPLTRRSRRYAVWCAQPGVPGGGECDGIGVGVPETFPGPDPAASRRRVQAMIERLAADLTATDPPTLAEELAAVVLGCDVFALTATVHCRSCSSRPRSRRPESRSTRGATACSPGAGASRRNSRTWRGGTQHRLGDRAGRPPEYPGRRLRPWQIASCALWAPCRPRDPTRRGSVRAPYERPLLSWPVGISARRSPYVRPGTGAPGATHGVPSRTS